MTNDVSVAAPTAVGLAHPKRWAILWTLLAVECMDLLDSTIVNVAAPTIRAELHASSTALQWIIGGYSLTYAIGLVTSGRLGDIWGRRQMFLLGAGGFVVSSVLCGLAPSTGTLVALRLVQGVFAAVMVPQGFGIIREVFPEDELPKVFGMFGPVIAVGMMLGPIVGGLLTDADLLGTGWRLIFFINVPLGLAAFVAGRRLLPASRGDHGLTLDVPGALTIALGSALLVYPLIQGRDEGWPWWTFAMLAAGFAVFAGFALVERRSDRPGHTPIVMPSLFSKRAFGSGILMTTLFFGAMTGMSVVLTLYVQIVLGFSAVHSGLTFVSWTLGAGFGAVLGGALTERIGRTTLHVGLASCVASVLLLEAVVGWSHGTLTTWNVFGPLLLFGLGSGLMVAPLFGTILTGVEADEVGSGSGVLNAMQQLGSAVGVAVFGTIYFSSAGAHGLREVVWIVGAVALVVGLMAFALPREGPGEEAAH